MEGWIKLHRKITKWDWYTNANTFRLFVHLLITANSKKDDWKGIVINRGECITGRKILSDELLISEQEIRTSLQHLKATNEITIKSTNKYSIITVCNYEEYQGLPPVKQPAKQPAKQPQTRSKEDKEINNSIISWRDDFKIYLDELKKNVEEIEKDAVWIAEQEQLNPNVDIMATIKKGVAVFWGVETEGYLNKKKQKTNTINWKSTFAKNMDKNIVWKRKKPIDDLPLEQNSFAIANGLVSKQTFQEI